MPPEKELTLSTKNNGQQFVINKNANVTIALKANPTTGYKWTLSEPDSTMIIQVGTDSFEADSKIIGAGGIQTFHFKIFASGKTRLKLIYHRPWEKDKKPLDSYIVFFNIKE